MDPPIPRRPSDCTTRQARSRPDECNAPTPAAPLARSTGDDRLARPRRCCPRRRSSHRFPGLRRGFIAASETFSGKNPAKRRIAALGKVLLTVLLGAFVNTSSVTVATAAKIGEGKQAIPFKGMDFLTGKELDLAQDLGKRAILLEFGSIYCSSCIVSVPSLIGLSQQYQENNLAVYNIYLDVNNYQRTIKFFRGFTKEAPIHLMIDKDLAVSREYGVENLPTTLIIDRTGNVRRRIVGFSTADQKEIEGIVRDLVQEHSLAEMAGRGGDGEQAFTVFTPESFTRTAMDAVTVVGYLGGEAQDVTLKLNNLPERTIRTANNVFHFTTPLSLAMNFIEVRGQVANDKVQSLSLVIFRETGFGGDLSSDLPRYVFHHEPANPACKKCHTIDLPPGNQTPEAQSASCGVCHPTAVKKRFVHEPLAASGCLACHDGQSYPNRFELRAPGAALCFTCHDSMGDELRKQTFLHGPVAGGACTVCHDPHGSNERFLLVKTTDRLCLGCHQELLKELTQPVIHEPFLRGRCTRCHDPHSSFEKLLLYPPKEVLCLRCHNLQKMEHPHPIGKKPRKPEAWPEEMLNKDGTTTCTTCHLHHASSQGKLARGPREECNRGCHRIK